MRSSATSPAAASTPPCRTPPPSILRSRRAFATNSADPATTEPTGAPRPLLRQTCTVSAPTVRAAGGTPSATAACQSRAPSRCTLSFAALAAATTAACSSGAVTVPPAALWVFSRQSSVVRSAWYGPAPPAAVEVVHEREEVAHRAAGSPQRVGRTDHPGDPDLQLAHRRVEVEDVVAHLGRGHRGPHLLGGLGDGVRAEVDRAVVGRRSPG